MLIGDLADEDYERFRQQPEFGSSDAASRLLTICGKRSVLIMEDEPVLAGRMASAFVGAGFARVVHCETGRRALAEASKAHFDVILLDRDNPDMEGLEVARAIRALSPASTNSALTPILIVTMLGSAQDRTAAHLAGVRFNDYVAKKDVNWEELLARAAAQIDNNGHARAEGDRFSWGALTIDPAARTLDFDGIDLPLRNRAFDIMLVLMRANGRPVTRHMLWQSCWNRPEYEGVVNVVNVAISDIRKRIRIALEAHNATADAPARIDDHLLTTEAFIYHVWNRGLAIREVAGRP